MKEFFQHWIDKTSALVTNWPALDRYTAIGLFLGVAGIAFNLVPLWRSKKWAELVLDKAMNNLRNKLRARLNRPELMTARSIRGLALAIQQSTQSAVITDAAITKTIRELALELEEESKHKGKDLTRRLRTLNDVLKEFDPTGPQLLSIAFHDRILAYVLSVLGISLTIFYIQFSLTYYGSHLTVNIAIWTLAFLQGFIIISTIRAVSFWRDRYFLVNSQSTDSLESKSPRAILDFFLSKAISAKFSVHTGWAATWEELLFRVLPYLFIPYLVALVTFKIGKLINIDDVVLRNVIGTELVVLYLVAIFFGTWVFAAWHEFNHFKVKSLRKKLNLLYRDVRLIELGHKPFQERTIRDYISISRELWILTGTKAYREMADEYSAKVQNHGVEESVEVTHI